MQSIPAPSIHVIGNVQLDVLASPVTGLPVPGGDTIVDRIDARIAGAAGNVSLALTALGTACRLFGAIGDDYAGRWILDDLALLGLAHDLIVVPGGATGISIALEAPDRERAFLTAHGVLENFEARSVSPEAVEADFVIFTGYFSMPGMRKGGARQLLEGARAQGAKTLFDTGWDPENWQDSGAAEVLDLIPLVDIFLPNEPEALALTGLADPAAAAAALAERSRGWVVVKLGDRGAVACNADGEKIRIDALAIEVTDTTGAGDSFAAGLITELAAGQGMHEALNFAGRLASTVVGRPSRDRYPSRQQVDAQRWQN